MTTQLMGFKTKYSSLEITKNMDKQLLGQSAVTHFDNTVACSGKVGIVGDDNKSLVEVVFEL